MAFSKLQQQSAAQTKAELLAAQKQVRELRTELSAAAGTTKGSESPESPSTANGKSVGYASSSAMEEELHAELRQSKRDLDNAQDASAGLELEAQLCQSLREEIAEAASSVPESFQEQLAESRGSCERLREELAETANSIRTDFQSELSEAQASCQRLQEELAQAMDSARQCFQEELAEAESTCQTLREELVQVSHMVSETTSPVKDGPDMWERDELREELAEETIAKSQLASGCEQLRHELREATAKSELASDCEQLRHELREAQDEAKTASYRAAASARAWGR